ncbi:DUF916 and DUF3324 domain-containing protein [Caldibacillus lycopersici]|uniref:DUF916 and DUF3324 domain-containing protein n=1 Tax=Perspicuibacillus lycopersici TaxID=1325689 RepID=A0AAE3IQJ3_9BACI|nr:DUF916 and DUF3324 domain-containing protein [Perspicuibacillus lycopersici]MCU9612577.1 DUF916 and DUF3324 domain-containing protein [Perspicuibacillus lycopersici]
MKYIQCFWILFAFLFLSFPTLMVYAAENENDFAFRVEPVFPASQIDNKGYYHFKGIPNQAIVLQARVINDSNSPLTVTISSFNAYSGEQGIVYQEKTTAEGTSITNEHYQFIPYVTTPSEIELGPLESKVIDFTVNIPDITGTLLGSIEFRVFKGTESVSGEDENSKFLIDQYRAVNIGVQVDITDVVPTSTITVTKPIYSPTLTAIMLPLENKQPVILPNITGTYKITKKGDENFLQEGEISEFKMAPMTTFQYPFRWANETLAAGTYTLNVTFNINGSNQSFEDTITIENNDIEETQQKMEARGEIQLETNPFPWIWAIIGSVVVLLLLVLVFILGSNKKKKKKSRKDRKYPGQFPDN